MKGVATLIVLAAAGLSTGKAEILFYGGDYDNVNGMRSQRGTDIDARVYDDFSLSEPRVVTGVFGSFFAIPRSTMAYFELRSGIEPGNGGTLLASGYFPVEATFLGGGLGFPVYRFSGKIAPVELASGDYWVTMAMVSSLDGNFFLATTSGANGIGGPLQNGNSFFDSTTFGYDFVDVQDLLGPGLWDFSIGLEGRPVPEAATIVTVLAGVALILRRSPKPR
ncbi:MAG: hypothetical protein ACR2HJ_06590 [Fimbriimonadales bacterium]